ILSSNEDSKLHELWILGQGAAHLLMPVVHECIARHESLAHPGVGIREINVISVDPEDDDIMSVIPFFGCRVGCPLFASPRLNKRNYRSASGSEPFDLLK